MKKYLFIVLSLSMTFVQNSYAQLSNDDWKKSLWMTTRMYGGQRLGNGPNWLIMDHNVSNNGKTRNGVDFINDSDGAYDLSGGWGDCGDHVKFGQTQYYSAYMLLVGYNAFPTGYDDYYSYDYSGYQGTQDFTWEGGDGIPNGIPDILDEVKHATDYFIKCIRNGTTFYSQVGNGDYDHKQWVTTPYMSTLSANNGGETRPVKKNPNDGSMVSFCGASLALMSEAYRKFDPIYADLCLQKALECYTYASNHKVANGGTISGNYYSADNNWKDNYVCLLAELYRATGQNSYKTEALSYANDSYLDMNWWVLDFENSQDLAIYNLKRLGNAEAATNWNNLVASYRSKKDGQDLIVAGGNWGRLRYCANAAFVLALDQKMKAQTTPEAGVIGTANYILGENSANQSFVVGFGSKSPKFPHHRNVYLDDNNDMDNVSIPARNAQHGFMVGGTNSPGSYTDVIHNFQVTEGCIDYQAGLVGLLGYIVSTKTPVDTSKFNPVSGFDAKENTLEIVLYPNPTKGTFQINTLLSKEISFVEMVVYQLDGKEVLRTRNVEKGKPNDLGALSEGTYIIELIGEDGSLYTTRITRQ